MLSLVSCLKKNIADIKIPSLCLFPHWNVFFFCCVKSFCFSDLLLASRLGLGVVFLLLLIVAALVSMFLHLMLLLEEQFEGHIYCGKSYLRKLISLCTLGLVCCC